MYKRIEEIIEESKDLGMTKSECDYAILKVFFKVNNPPRDLEKLIKEVEPKVEEIVGELLK